MKAICFKCHFVGIGVAEPRCPSCGFPLIVNTEPVALGARDLEAMFSRPAEAPPLPGISPEPRKAVILATRRRERAQAMAEQQRKLAMRRRHIWILGEIAAASAILVGALFALHQLGAL